MAELVREITLADVAEGAKVQRLKPTEKDLEHLPGFRRTHYTDAQCAEVGKAPGYYTWEVEVKANEHGKPTKEACEVGEMLAPFQQADTARHAELEQRVVPRMALYDGNGSPHHVDAAHASGAAERNGWHHRISTSRAATLSVGVTGDMLWRRHKGEWEPSGRAQLGVFGRRADRKLVQVDPDGWHWCWLKGRWQRVEVS